MSNETTTHNGPKKKTAEEIATAAEPFQKTPIVPFDAVKATRAPKAALDASEAVRLMLTTLKRVPDEQRAKVLATLASLA